MACSSWPRAVPRSIALTRPKKRWPRCVPCRGTVRRSPAGTSTDTATRQRVRTWPKGCASWRSSETMADAVAKAIGKVALLWRGDRQARDAATPETSRFQRVFEALARRNILAEPAVYADEMADEVRTQLLRVDGVLVWVDPISNGQTRAGLDPMLRDVARRGVWVSAHPDIIMKMGVKEVLHRTKDFGWGTDTHVYRSSGSFRGEFPARLRKFGPRVLKRNRGNGGQGVWKGELLSESPAVPHLQVLEARRCRFADNMGVDGYGDRFGEGLQ